LFRGRNLGVDFDDGIMKARRRKRGKKCGGGGHHVNKEEANLSSRKEKEYGRVRPADEKT